MIFSKEVLRKRLKIKDRTTESVELLSFILCKKIHIFRFGYKTYVRTLSPFTSLIYFRSVIFSIYDISSYTTYSVSTKLSML